MRTCCISWPNEVKKLPLCGGGFFLFAGGGKIAGLVEASIVR